MSERGVITDGAVYVDAGTIEHVRQRTAKLPDSKYRGAARIRTGGTIFPGFIELHNHLAYNAMSLWDVPTRYTNNGKWRGTEPYTRRITQPSQVLGQSNGAAQALVRYTECRALLGGTTCSQGLTLANAGGVTKLYAGLLRNPEAPDDPRLPPAGTNIANPETAARSPTPRRWRSTPATCSTCRKARTRRPVAGSSGSRSRRTAGPSTTACARSTAPRWTPTTSGGSPVGERRWCGRR